MALLIEQGEMNFDNLKNFISDEFSIEEENDLIQRAWVLANKEHEGQMRKDGKKYITHPETVASIASMVGLPQKLIILSFLHDTYEDSRDKNSTQNNIIKNFGLNIYNDVKSLSHEKDIEYSNYVKQLLKKGNTDLFLVKMCDMLHNLSDNPKNPKKYINTLRDIYSNKETSDIINKLQKKYPSLFSAIATKLKSGNL